MLRDYPEHIVRLQEVLNSAIDPTKTHLMPFDEAIWALEGALEAFIDETRKELRAAEASGDPAAIARAEEKISLMRRAHSSNGGMRDLHTLRMYFDANKRAFE
ncbi:hypothetical protein EBB59_05970 [Lysobacter pythonis]|uniref:Uncharacterized protein n=2 Tax=Solilutibacter pythonis TaxID=2483112 RepID=A0A3M2HWI9_9GAMM|nr:hypothetical protein EBB59_05970 [Lysobacter pythonis]